MNSRQAELHEKARRRLERWRAMLAAGLSRAEIARREGISKQRVSRVLREAAEE